MFLLEHYIAPSHESASDLSPQTWLFNSRVFATSIMSLLLYSCSDREFYG
jgi:hypothetical protein